MNEEDNYKKTKVDLFAKAVNIIKETQVLNETINVLQKEAYEEIVLIAEQTNKTFEERIQEIVMENTLFLEKMEKCYREFLSFI